MMNNIYFKQALRGGAAGLVMIIAGAAWVFLAAQFAFNLVFPAVIGGLSFNNKLIYNAEIIIVLLLLCFLPFALKAHRLVKTSVFYLVFPIIWAIVIGTILYGKVFPQEVIAPINNRSTMLVPIYGGAVIIPVLAVAWGYFRYHKDKFAEFAAHAVLFTVMTLGSYMFINILIIICANFGECM
jgi:hypothetical protein